MSLNKTQGQRSQTLCLILLLFPYLFLRNCAAPRFDIFRLSKREFEDASFLAFLTHNFRQYTFVSVQCLLPIEEFTFSKVK